MPTFISPQPDDERFMRLALDACRAGVMQGQTPFGACIVRGGEVIESTHNHVWLTIDPTAHAEVHCIRHACQKLNTIDLTGATIYSTTEPCPMCFSAIHWSRIERIVYGANIADAQSFGFNELIVTNEQLIELGKLSMQLTPGFMRDEAIELFKLWQQRGGQTY